MNIITAFNAVLKLATEYNVITTAQDTSNQGALPKYQFNRAAINKVTEHKEGLLRGWFTEHRESLVNRYYQLQKMQRPPTRLSSDALYRPWTETRWSRATEDESAREPGGPAAMEVANKIADSLLNRGLLKPGSRDPFIAKGDPLTANQPEEPDLPEYIVEEETQHSVITHSLLQPDVPSPALTDAYEERELLSPMQTNAMASGCPVQSGYYDANTEKVLARLRGDLTASFENRERIRERIKRLQEAQGCVNDDAKP